MVVLKKSVFFILFFLLINILYLKANANKELNDIRKLYVESLLSVSKTDALLKNLSNKQQESALYLGYYGAVQGLKAKHAYNPFTKLDYLNQSKSTLEKAIKKDPSNPELRFLRFSMEHYIPAWLGYSSNIKNDKKAILDNVSNIQDMEVKKVIVKFLLESKRCSLDEESDLKKLILN